MRKIVLPLFINLFFISTAYATLDINPQRIEAVAKPNLPFKGSYSVTNNYDGDVEVNISAVLNKERSYEGNENIPLDSWLTITPSKLHIRKGETRLVLYSILTNSFMQGSIYAQVLFKLNPPGNSGVNVLMKLPVHITLQGTEKIDYAIESISINAQNKFQIAIRNNGNTNIKPVGWINIYQGKKKIKATQLLESLYVFSGTLRDDFFADCPQDLAAGKYKVEVVLEALGYRYAKSVKKSVQFRVLKDGRMIM